MQASRALYLIMKAQLISNMVLDGLLCLRKKNTVECCILCGKVGH